MECAKRQALSECAKRQTLWNEQSDKRYGMYKATSAKWHMHAHFFEPQSVRVRSKSDFVWEGVYLRS